VTDSIHKLGEVLRTARESKGVDVGRVERDTKIRSRYLSALERGDYRDLPGAVYTKGFLRNYGLYLGLDPEYLVDLYRLETGAAAAERVRSTPPRARSKRRPRALVVTPGAIFAAILTIGVALFVAYLGYEFVTFARTPDLRVVDPAGDIASWGELRYTIRGTTEPNSRVTIDGLSENPVVTADASGNFQVVVQLVPGSNVITVVATDPATQRDSMKVTRTIIVGSAGSPTPGAPSVVVNTPADKASLSGPLTVSGFASPGATLRIAARLLTAASAGFSVKTAAGAAVHVPSLAIGAVRSSSATADLLGAFSTTMVLPPGTWDVTVSGEPATTSPAPSGASPPTAAGATTRRVTVKPASGVSGTAVIGKAASYLLVLRDGVPVAGVSGRVFPPGRTIPLTARSSIVVRAGNAAVVTITINGITLGVMGGAGEVVEWHIQRTG